MNAWFASREGVSAQRCVWALILVTFIGVLGVVPSAGAQTQNDIRMQVSGEAVVLAVDDFVTHTSGTVHFVREEKTQKLWPLKFAGEAPREFGTGARIGVNGASKSGELWLRAEDVQIATNARGSRARSGLEPPGIETVQAHANDTSTQVQTQNVIVMLINDIDQGVACSLSVCGNSVFGATDSTKSVYAETSYGKLAYTGNVVGPFSIAVKTTDPCPSPWLPTLETWAALADAQAQAAGVDLTSYTEKVYAMPTKNPCGSERGYATIGGSPGMAWIFQTLYPAVFVHEMGHNLGMYHARTAESEYGDLSDIMGLTTIPPRDLNAAHRDELHWIPEANLPTLTAGGTFTIAPLETPPSMTTAPLALKIPKPDTHEYYYLSFRQPAGFDAILPTFNSGVYTNGISVHRFAGADANDARTYFLQGLTDGSSFVDSANQISVTQTAHDASSGASVVIGLGPANATLSESALGFADQAAGSTSAAKTFTVRNTGWTALGITSIGISGANAEDFAIASNTCGNSLGSGANCAVGIAFAPSTTGMLSASLIMADDAGTQEVSLGGNGVSPPNPDFSLSATSGATLTVSAGTAATFTLTIDGSNGFSGTVNVSCAVAAVDATCSATPSSVAAGKTITVTVDTMAHQMLPLNRERTPIVPLMELLLAGVFATLAGLMTRPPRFCFRRALPAYALLAIAAGCGGGAPKTIVTQPAIHGTQAGPYSVTVTGTAMGVTRQTTLTLIIK